MSRSAWDRVIQSLLCIRLGQELGTSSELAQAVANAVEAILAAVRIGLDHF